MNGAIAEVFALGGDAEDVADKEFGDKTLVIVMHLERAVHPTDRRAHRRFGLDQHQRKAIDQQNQIGAALGWPGPEGILRGGDILVIRQIVKIEQTDGDMLMIRAKGHGAFAAQPGGQFLIGPHQPVTAHGKHDGAQLVDHLIGAFRFFRNGGIEADQGVAHIGFDQHLLRLPGQDGRRHKMPACATTGEAVRDIRHRHFRHPLRRLGQRPTEQITDQGFDGVRFGKRSHNIPSNTEFSSLERKSCVLLKRFFACSDALLIVDHLRVILS